MNVSEIKEFLTNTDEGKALFAEMTDGLKGNRDKILTEKKTLQEQLNEISSQMDSLRTQLNQERQRSNTLTAQREINSEFDKFNVPREVRPILENHFSSLEGLKINDAGSVTIGETNLSEYLAEFFQSETGKRFSLIRSSGSGATGSRGTFPNSSEDEFRKALQKSI